MRYLLPPHKVKKVAENLKGQTGGKSLLINSLLYPFMIETFGRHTLQCGLRRARFLIVSLSIHFNKPARVLIEILGSLGPHPSLLNASAGLLFSTRTEDEGVSKSL